MTNFQLFQTHFKNIVITLLCFCTICLQAQTADLSLIHTQLPDTVVIGDTITLSTYLKNNTTENYTNDNLQLNLYVNEVQDVDKTAVIESLNVINSIDIPAGDSILIAQEVVIDELLFQIGEQQPIQKNIIIVWPTEDGYSIDFHLQPIVVLKQAFPEAVFNNSPALFNTDILNSDLPEDALNYIDTEYANYTLNEALQQSFNDGSIQFEVNLEDGDTEVKLYFSETGILVLTETEFDESALSFAIQNFIATEHPTNSIESTYLLVFSDGTIQYLVELENDDIELYFDVDGNNILEIGIIVELYEEPNIELSGLTLPDASDLGENIEVTGSLTNHLAIPYNDVFIPINYAALPFPPTIDNPNLRTQTTDIDLIAPSETVSFQQNLSVDDGLFYEGRNIIIVWPTEYAMNLTSNCIVKEIFVEIPRDTVGIETISELSSDIVIAPNPTLQYLNIQTNQLQIEAITIYDLASKPIENYSSIRQNSFHTDLSHLNKGLYLLYIQTDKGNAVKKLIVN
ncbi:MAG: T9SS type A sorting domain-containing protein [Chitinophagales bacterium]